MLTSWDEEILAIELENLLVLDLDFEVTAIGFEMGEIDLLLQKDADTEPDPADEAPPLQDGPAVTQSGDLWLIGPHRLYCGDALASSSYAALMAGEAAEMIFTDPPYNVPIAGHVSGLGQVQHREFAMASGEMTEAEFTRFLTTTFRQMAAASAEGSVHYVCIDWRHLHELLRAGRIAYSTLLNICVWAKANGGMGSLYRSQHELVAVFKRGELPHINNVQLGRHGRNRTNVWNYAGMNSFQEEREDKLALHPTLKPVALVADAILDCSKRGSVILDPFAGAGTTIVAAQPTGRRCFAMEIDPLYVESRSGASDSPPALSRFLRPPVRNSNLARLHQGQPIPNAWLSRSGRTSMSNSNGSRDSYEVGKGRPLKEHHFAKGTSGNPKGRPPKKKDEPVKRSFNLFVDAVLSETERLVPVREGGKESEMTVFKAALRQLGNRAARGEARATAKLIDLRAAAQKLREEEMLGMLRAVKRLKPSGSGSADRRGHRDCRLPTSSRIRITLPFATKLD